MDTSAGILSKLSQHKHRGKHKMYAVATMLLTMGCSPQDNYVDESRSQSQAIETPALASESSREEPSKKGRHDHENVALISMDDIYGNAIGGVRNVEELEPDKFGDSVKGLDSSQKIQLIRNSLTHQIRSSLRRRPTDEGEVGFAVDGSRLEALRNVHSVLVGGEQPKSTFSTGDVSVVFFLLTTSCNVRMHEAKRSGSTLVVEYSLGPRHQMVMTEPFAIIALSELPLGVVRVEFVHLQAKTEESFRKLGFPIPTPKSIRPMAAESFEFLVNERAKVAE